MNLSLPVILYTEPLSRPVTDLRILFPTSTHPGTQAHPPSPESLENPPYMPRLPLGPPAVIHFFSCFLLIFLDQNSAINAQETGRITYPVRRLTRNISYEILVTVRKEPLLPSQG